MKAIAAMSLNRVIARDGQIPWHLPEDFKWFKRMTLGHTVVMGRKTFESLGKPLPGRENVVLTRAAAEYSGVRVLREEGEVEGLDSEVWVIGGAEVFRQLLPRCSDLYLTVVDREVEGDTFFPEFEDDFAFVAVVLEQPDFEVRHYRNRKLLLAL